jgi:hypothetical protein
VVEERSDEEVKNKSVIKLEEPLIKNIKAGVV